MSTPAKVNLLDFTRERMRQFFQEQGEAAFRGDQAMKWIHDQGHADLSNMTNISKRLRDSLASIAEIRLPEIVTVQKSSDGTRKWVLKLDSGNSVETVYIPEDDRGTLCVSSQVGCAIKCTFCATGKQGFNRNLSVAEIIGQVWIAVRELSEQEGRHDRHITNVVMMGMGEPLLNYDNVVQAMDIMMDDFAYGLSKRRVTLSTSGIIPYMHRLAQESPVSLAVSLHAPNDALRDILVPVNRKYKLAELMAVCRTYFENEPRRYVTFEYVMLKGVNDQLEHAKQLVKILKGVPSKVNLIPYNPIAESEYECSSLATINEFRDFLVSHGINTITRKTRGDDIDAACGQLVGQVAERQRRNSEQVDTVNT